MKKSNNVPYATIILVLIILICSYILKNEENLFESLKITDFIAMIISVILVFITEKYVMLTSRLTDYTEINTEMTKELISLNKKMVEISEKEFLTKTKTEIYITIDKNTLLLLNMSRFDVKEVDMTVSNHILKRNGNTYEIGISDYNNRKYHQIDLLEIEKLNPIDITDNIEGLKEMTEEYTDDYIFNKFGVLTLEICYKSKLDSKIFYQTHYFRNTNKNIQLAEIKDSNELRKFQESLSAWIKYK